MTTNTQQGQRAVLEADRILGVDLKRLKYRLLIDRELPGLAESVKVYQVYVDVGGPVTELLVIGRILRLTKDVWIAWGVDGPEKVMDVTFGDWEEILKPAIGSTFQAWTQGGAGKMLLEKAKAEFKAGGGK